MRAHCKPLSLLIAAALGIAFATSAMAADASPTSKAEYHQALASAKANYKTAYAACAEPGRLKCRQAAHADWDKAKADAREAHGMPRYAGGPRN